MIHVGDCLEVMRKLEANSFDSIVTDPPYGLSFMGKRWDYDVPSVEVWAECLRVLKPGGHLLAFAGTRTQHRMAVRIEDAGFEIRDMIAWVYGSGFPKSRDISKDMDRIDGAEREVVGKIDAPGMARANVKQWAQGRSVYTFDKLGGPVSDAARQWQGWGTALKPALEPITVARKPLVGTVAENVLAWGTGALNIDGCRVGISAEDAAYITERIGGFNATKSIGGNGAYSGGEVMDRAEAYDASKGRWPANLIHDGSEEVVALFPANAGAAAPVRGTEKSHTGGDGTNCYGEYGRIPGTFFGDTGSAARFFYCAKASRADRNDGCDGMEERPLLWSSGTKAPGTFQAEGTRRASENNHPTVKPTDLMRWLCRLVTPPGGLVLDPFCGSGSTGRGAIAEGFRFTGIELDPHYARIAEARIRAIHPGLCL
ncbi:site-specific DNA-methyltransferase [Thermomonas sp. S9]|uniref:DNA-methyltransferase n=1 Tax=Thermomonas sp. S9 TaxID=2885203 RepID=UPI00216B0FAA|nr:DNA methyltransferase [Thermomonas sp. S9]MCR6496188.1 site-specific DNA-methyltransferase [Thermomonas sp. S9]